MKTTDKGKRATWLEQKRRHINQQRYSYTKRALACDSAIHVHVVHKFLILYTDVFIFV